MFSTRPEPRSPIPRIKPREMLQVAFDTRAVLPEARRMSRNFEREHEDDESVDPFLAGRQWARPRGIFISRVICGVGRDCGDELHCNRGQHDIRYYGNKTDRNLDGRGVAPPLAFNRRARALSIGSRAEETTIIRHKK